MLGTAPCPATPFTRLLSAFGHGEGVATMASERGEPRSNRLPRSMAASVTSHDPMARQFTELGVRCFHLAVNELDSYAARLPPVVGRA
jgi:hypothetical protein